MAGKAVFEKFWDDKFIYSDSEKQFYEGQTKDTKIEPPIMTPVVPEVCTVNNEKKSGKKANKKSSKERKISTNSDKSTEPIKEIPKTVPEKSELPKNVPKPSPKAAETVVKASTPAPEKSELPKNAPTPIVKNPEPPKNITPPPISQSEPPKEAPAPPADNTKKSKSKEKENKKKNKKANKIEKEQPKPVEIAQVVEEVSAPVESPQGTKVQNTSGQCTLASEVAKARQHIKKSLECMDTVLSRVPNDEVEKKLNQLLEEINSLKLEFRSFQTLVTDEIKQLKQKSTVAACPVKPPAPAQAKPAACNDDDEDDGVDLFASDSDDDAEAAKIRDQRLAEYAAKKSKKPALIAKSNIILDCKPWDDETDMKKMEELVRSIQMDGLLWGASKFVPLAYGIQKLQISCVVEDEKVSIDLLQEEIQNFEDYVQSVDIAAFNKI